MSTSITEQEPKKLSEMAIGEQGFCSLSAHYAGLARPLWGQNAQVLAEMRGCQQMTTERFLLQSPVYPTRTPNATLAVKREDKGYSVRFPVGWSPRKFLAPLPANPLPIVGTNQNQPN